MTNDHDALAGLLFGPERKLMNFKMLRGDNPNVKEQELRDEAHAALLQVRLGHCESFRNFPEEASARVDVMKISETLTA